ncbi:MAG TPA: glycosyl hydrolase 53 family protein [Candidatus Acidoferrum sp.]|nr:glycosyl hydrolase 53 family protein [Candidatus Acidoferrum sp.]
MRWLWLLVIGLVAISRLLVPASILYAQTGPVFTDSFTGNRLNLSRWDLFPQNGATISTGAGLQISLNGTPGFSQIRAFTLYHFTGDFDAQVDFNLGAGWNTTFPTSDTSPQLNGGGIAVYLDDPNWMVLFRSRFSGTEGFNFYSNVSLGGSPTSVSVPSTAASGSLRIVSSAGTYHFSYNTGAGWVELATAPAWNRPIRLYLTAGNVAAHVSFSTTLNNFRVNSGTIDYVPYQLPNTFLRRPTLFIGGQFVQEVIDRWFGGFTSYRPIEQLYAQGMSMARGCMTTISSPDLQSTPPAQWHTLVWLNSYWSSLEMMTQQFKDATAAGTRINACFYLSDGPANAGLQNAPASWSNLSVSATASLVQQYTYNTTTTLRSQGIKVDYYDIGNEILQGILNFLPGQRIAAPLGVNVAEAVSYLQTSVWPTEATLLNAAIAGVRGADPGARIVLHVESATNCPGMETAFAFFQAMQTLGVSYDVAALSLPYVNSTDMSSLTARDYFQRWNDLVNRIAALGKPVYIAENSYPAATLSTFYPPIPDFPYTDAGQAAYVHSQLLWASNNPNIIGWTWFYPEWFPGIASTPAPNLEVSGLFSDRTTLRPAAKELNAIFAPKRRSQVTSE